MQEERQDTLSNDAIASATKAFEAALKDSDIPRSLAVRATILMEELLLRYQEQFGHEAGFSFLQSNALAPCACALGSKAHSSTLSTSPRFGDLVRFAEVCSFSASEHAPNKERLRA